jgi:hypothetical protein
MEILPDDVVIYAGAKKVINSQIIPQNASKIGFMYG